MSEFIEIPASKISLALRKPVCGVGINDAKYAVNKVRNGERARCPYYMAWNSMISRSYSDKYQESRPTYVGCFVIEEWLVFSNFKRWMKEQDWEGRELDKDILISGNKVYSPDTCIFVSKSLNQLLTDSSAIRGSCPQGVSLYRNSEKYQSRCKVKGKQKHLGYFALIENAEKAYLTFKSALVKKIASESESESNPKLKEALLRHSELFKRKADAITSQMIKGRMM